MPLIAKTPDGGSSSNNAEIKSYLGQSSLPRGMRNNNPGNIRIGTSDWIGKIPIVQNTDGEFEQFEYYKYGVRALMVLLRTYINQGHDTIHKIISKYAPSSENNTNAYINSVVYSTGFSAHLKIKFMSSHIFPIVKAIGKHENGQDAITDEDLNLAWSLI
ncbi:MAG: hypothetical protein IT273_14655 [Chitinophagales bacterium]|nr:hypothetical protein [Chitinophagales bacterium]